MLNTSSPVPQPMSRKRRTEPSLSLTRKTHRLRWAMMFTFGGFPSAFRRHSSAVASKYANASRCCTDMSFDIAVLVLSKPRTRPTRFGRGRGRPTVGSQASLPEPAAIGTMIFEFNPARICRWTVLARS
ncbi:MAG: hypothetical protein WD099_01150, partial [Dongiaceae bacterium]